MENIQKIGTDELLTVPQNDFRSSNDKWEAMEPPSNFGLSVALQMG